VKILEKQFHFFHLKLIVVKSSFGGKAKTETIRPVSALGVWLLGDAFGRLIFDRMDLGGFLNEKW